MEHTMATCPDSQVPLLGGWSCKTAAWVVTAGDWNGRQPFLKGKAQPMDR